MAARAQRQMASQGGRGNGARATPPLQTSNHAPSQRFSYAETPVEAERATFQPFQPYHQFSSPTNSTIEESPISPASPSRGLPSYPQGSPTPVPIEKAQVQSPQEIHPAFFAPFREESTRQNMNGHTQPVPGPQSPGPIPLKAQPAAHPARAPTDTTFAPPPTITPESDPKVGVEHRGTYNPNSLAGPNGAPENHRPGQVSHPNSAVDPHWKNGLCEADTLCCMGLVCPCMVYGKTMYRLSRKAQKQDPTDLLGYESCNGGCGFMAAACGFQCTDILPGLQGRLVNDVTGILAAIHRTRIRKLYHIEGSFGTDCVNSLCCCCCVVMQNEREVREREELIRRHAGPATGAYVAPGQMTYAPPPR